MYCNRLSPKCKSQLMNDITNQSIIVTDYRLNANHNPLRSYVMSKVL
ncbi:hypothetical protein BSPCLSOX_322 [uncultured Gammaproteobacteria bacterium]|nr:hypothetical protein BSPCLSOX_322 [uncultured Gammaproteobacteria bacterium]